MALVPTTVPVGDHNVVVGTTAPTAQLSTAATVVVTGSDVDARGYSALAYTIIVATQDVSWSVFGANVSDFSDEKAVLTATQVVAGATGNYAVSPPPYGYYRSKIIDTAGGVHGSVTINIIAKP